MAKALPKAIHLPPSLVSLRWTKVIWCRAKSIQGIQAILLRVSYNPHGVGCGYRIFILSWKPNNRVKKLILGALLMSFSTEPRPLGLDGLSTTLLEVRSGSWPINLDRSIENRDTSYFLEFRDEQVLSTTVLDTLPFPDLSQLRYFEKALSALKNGTNGDIAKFKNYSIKRAEKKYEGTWYILRAQYGTTDFQQPEADLMIKTIRSL